MCLGIAARGEPGVSLELQAVASAALRAMARRGIGIEVLPIGNVMLHDEDDLKYYRAFVSHGVAMSVGSDDPGFTGAELEVEVAMAQAWAAGNDEAAARL